ncbi:MAG: hypothetical protein K0U86_05560 [Planctomycetes bacterium]|nr:hypothetical protein [Planctomycetota bacterium]MCH9724356.1 hypothetical protein [Planctomycetota bacterium]MCH9778219.1 hypothetical protein [Planctomycetota bacterium]
MMAHHRGILKTRLFCFVIPSPYHPFLFIHRTVGLMKLIFSSLSYTNLLFLLLLCSLPGCMGNGGEPTPDLGEVTGTITLDGTPLSKANVTFQPAAVGDKGRSRASSAITSADGQFKLAYNSDTSGASIGKHKVIISKMSDNPEEAGLQLVPTKYNDATELTADVVAGENTINFDLKSK